MRRSFVKRTLGMICKSIANAIIGSLMGLVAGTAGALTYLSARYAQGLPDSAPQIDLAFNATTASIDELIKCYDDQNPHCPLSIIDVSLDLSEYTNTLFFTGAAAGIAGGVIGLGYKLTKEAISGCSEASKDSYVDLNASNRAPMIGHSRMNYSDC